MKLFTIGFTKTTAERFFNRLRRSGAKTLVDVRLNNVSQLAGFAKRDDLKFFARELSGMGYIHLPQLAPTKDMLDALKKDKGPWSAYEGKFLELMESRCIEESVPKDVLDGGCLLCSEDKPHHCHRRLVAEYLDRKWGGIKVEHL